jgi:D-inositol-3-phosphate glycosyltransferase
MRICFYNVTASFIPGGLETYCWEVGRALARRGHEVTIAAGDRGGPRHDEVALVRFPFRIEQSWPHLGHRFPPPHGAPVLRGTAAGSTTWWTAGYDAVVINKPFDFPGALAARAGAA